MPFPRKYQHLLDLEAAEVEAPDHVWLVYAVCSVTPEGCGWGGWMIDGVFKSDPERPTNDPWGGRKLLPSANEQVCPRCGRETFRTGASLRVEPSKDQSPDLRPDRDYELLPIEYDD